MFQKIFKLFFLVIFIQVFAKDVVDDYEKALHLAREHQLPIAVLFTGSDWSEESEACLKEWKEHAEELRCHFIMTWIDFPEINTFSSEKIEKHFGVKEKFNIMGLPTLLLLSPEGDEITRMGYPLEETLTQILKTKLYLHSHIKEDWKTVQETHDEQLLFSCYQKLQALNCSNLQEELLAFAVKHQLCSELLVDHYIALVSAGKDMQAAELRKQIPLCERLALFDFQQKNSVAALENYLENHEASDWKLEFFLSEHLFATGLVNEALKYAWASYNKAPQSEKSVVTKMINLFSKESF